MNEYEVDLAVFRASLTACVLASYNTLCKHNEDMTIHFGLGRIEDFKVTFSIALDDEPPRVYNLEVSPDGSKAKLLRYAPADAEVEVNDNLDDVLLRAIQQALQNILLPSLPVALKPPVKPTHEAPATIH